MAIELRIEVAIVDAEPDLSSHQGIIARVGRIRPLIAEVPDMGAICAIADSAVDKEIEEVRHEFKDVLDTIPRQGGG
jgi:hypothetical protein